MNRPIFRPFVALAVVAACGGSTATVDGSDAGGGDAEVSGPADATLGDGSAPPGSDSSVADAPAPSDAAATGDAASDASADAVACSECKPDFCGCGQCTPDQVVCTKNPINCPLDCVSSCDLSQFTCACEADRCVRVSPPPGNVIPCYTTLDCPPGNCCKKRSGPLQGACVAGDTC